MKTVTQRTDVAHTIAKMMQRPDPFPTAALRKYFAKRKEEEKEKFKEQREYFEGKSRLNKTASAPLLEQMGPEKYRRLVNAFHQWTNRRAVRKLKRPHIQSVSPRITGGSLDLVLPPPYQDLTVITNGGATGLSDGRDGYARLNLGQSGGIGGSPSGSAGVVGFYLPVSGSPLGHCRPYIQTYHEYHEFAVGACAHTTGTLSVTVVDVAAFFFGQIATAGTYTWLDRYFRIACAEPTLTIP